jgi:lipoate---protein ligase
MNTSNNWRILPLTVADQQSHIDRSESLLQALQPGDEATLYWSMAASDGLVLGFSQKPDTLNRAMRAGASLPIYHRRAGGTAVLVGPHLLSLDAALPADHPLTLPDIVESYRWLGEAWVVALQRLGITARTVSPDEAHAQRDLLKHEETRERETILRRACYGAHSPYEVVAGQRKVVGLDMIRRRQGSLLQAGVLLRWEMETLAQWLGHTPEEQHILRTGLRDRAVGLDELAGRAITAEEVIAAFELVIGSLPSPPCNVYNGQK